MNTKRILLASTFAVAMAVLAGQQQQQRVWIPEPPLLNPQLYRTNGGGRLWTANNNTIPTCWDTSGYAREKLIITNAVTRTWQTVANVHFTWREGCPKTGSDLYVKVQIGRHTAVGADPSGKPIFDHSTDGQTRPGGMDSLSEPTSIPLQVQGSPGVYFLGRG